MTVPAAYDKLIPVNVKRENFIPTGRFAPTPSGELHAGNLICALLSYLSAKSAGGKFLVRIEDLDPERCPRGQADKILRTLDKLGLTGDEEPLFQSERSPIYRGKEQELRKKARIYPCFCTRAQLHAAEAPRLQDGVPLYPGFCRDLTEKQIETLSKTRRPCLRIEVPDEEIGFNDRLAGRVTQNLKRECGDFIIKRSDGVYAYQLAVSVDDGESGVTEVVRGNDLIASTPRQIWLMRLLGYRPPQYYHIPLVCDETGRKLGKSDGDGDSRLVASYPRERILGFLAFSAGLLEKNRPASLEELVSLFSWDKVPKNKIIFNRNLI